VIGWIVAGVVALLIVLVVAARLSFGRTARGMASYGKAEALRELLAKQPGGATEADENGEQPIHAAAGRGHADVIDVLLAHGASANARCTGGGTPLTMAVFFGNAAATQRLLAGGADPDDCDDTGMTALHAAVAKGNAELAGVLLDAGAQADLKDAAGRTALDVAEQLSQPELAKLLTARGARRGSQVRMRELKPPKSAGGMHRVPEVLGLPTDSPALQKAKAEAQASLPQLRELFGQKLKTAVKGPVDPRQPDEKMWMGVNVLSDTAAFGFLMSNPLQSGEKPGAAAQLALPQIEDWLVELPDGRLRGGYGLKVLFEHAREEYGALPASYTDVAGKLTP